MKGEKDVWACRWVYTHFKYHAVCICPTKSLVNNIGFDGSGSNCGFSKKYEQSLQVSSVEKWRLPITAHVNPLIFERFMLVMDKNWRLNHRKFDEVFQKKIERSLVIQHIKNRIKPIAKIALGFLTEIKSVTRRLGLKSRISTINQTDAQFVSAEHKKVSSKSNTNLVRLGTDYGGWWVPEIGLSRDDFIVSAGAGEDISFDIELAKRYGCSVLILDPTPRAATHFNRTVELIRKNQPAPINESTSEFYQAHAKDIKNIKFRPLGLWSENSIQHFFVPANPNNVSHSIDNMHGTEAGFDAECVSLSEVLKLEGREKISLLKLDIEGAEFTVLCNLLEIGHKPSYILVEFHAGHDEIERLRRTKTIRMLKNLHKVGYRVVKQNGWDYVLELQ
jgi:FkbM family methyltransferase